MSFLDSSNTTLDPNWARGKYGRFNYFFDLDPEEEGLNGVSGIYVIWHGGVRPGWVYLGKSKDLSETLHKLGKNKEIAEYEVNGRLFVSWAMIQPQFQDGVLRYLIDILHPSIENPDSPSDKVNPIPVYAPGYAADKNA